MLSQSAKSILLASWRPGTLKQYESSLKKWGTFCSANTIHTYHPSVEEVIEFLTSLYQQGLGYSAINTARSALSSIITLPNNNPLGEHPLIKRFLKGIFELRPALPKYSFIWDVSLLLKYLKRFKSADTLGLKELTMKTVCLLTVLTGQRCQTIHNIDINNIQMLPDFVRIIVSNPIKTTRPGHHPKPLEFKSYTHDRDLCIVSLLSVYLRKTADLRKQHTQLFISFHKPHNPVSRDTISRWIKSTLKAAGIDTNVFSAHSCRSAATSASKSAGFSLTDIMSAAGWSGCSTFAKFYDKCIVKDNFGQKVLENFQK